MKILAWSLCVVLALFWTGLVALTAEAARWISSGLASGQVKDFANGAAQWPAPDWLLAWIDPHWMQMLQSSLLYVFNTVANLSPQLSSVVSWMVPLIWVVWGVGMLSLVGLTGGAHWLIGRLQRNSTAVV
jgi:hypothetical protein